jgi:hypothetical protein
MKSLLLSALVMTVVVFAPDASAEEEPPRGVSLAMEVVFGRSFVSVTGSPDLVLRGLPELRQPQWTGPDPPKPPPFHVRLLRITF